MLISFSLPIMLPMVVNGLIAAKVAGHGKLALDVERWLHDTFPAETATAGRRVKGQTIRTHNATGRSNYANRRQGDRLDIWWKSRTPGRRKLGEVILPVDPIQIRIIHREGGIPAAFSVEPGQAAALARPWSDMEVEAVALADGFDSVTAFRDFFAPLPGDSFTGWLVKWI